MPPLCVKITIKLYISNDKKEQYRDFLLKSENKKINNNDVILFSSLLFIYLYTPVTHKVAIVSFKKEILVLIIYFIHFFRNYFSLKKE